MGGGVAGVVAGVSTGVVGDGGGTSVVAGGGAGADSAGVDAGGGGVATTPGGRQVVTVTVDMGSEIFSNASNLGGWQIITSTSHQLEVDSFDDLSWDIASCVRG